MTEVLDEKQLLEQRILEYTFLRTELEAIWNQTYSTLNLMLVGVGLFVTAAFAQYGDPVILLPIASLITVGGYRLIFIHTTRVWRIVGYMRCALEPKLSGLRWETRLKARHNTLKSHGNDRLDKDIFDGHFSILSCVNIAIFLGILASAFWGKSNAMNDLRNQDFLWTRRLVVCSAVPVLTLIVAFLKNSSLNRGGEAEAKHVRSWKQADENGVPAAEAEPPINLKNIVE